MTRHDIGGARRLLIDPDLPCPTIMAGGVGSVNCSQYEIDMKLRFTAPWRIETVIDLETSPAPSIMGYGIGGAYRDQYWLDDADT